MTSQFRKRLPERLALVGIMVLTLILLLASIRFERHINRQKTMFYELQVLRISIQLYKAVERRNPNTLEELVMGEYSFPGESERRRFLEYTPALNDQGLIADPFGYPYVYNPKTAWIRSSTPGYEFW